MNFVCDKPSQVKKEFQKAVDDYLLICEEVGKNPEKEYKGSFNVRLKPALHKKLAAYSSKNGETLNHTVEKAIEAYIA